MKTFLLSVDLEDLRDRMPQEASFVECVPQMTEKYLSFFRDKGLQVTFFVVGDVARRYPHLIKRIADEGHEIGCHSNTHVALDKLTQESFRKDLEANIESILQCGVKRPTGFRAPIFSLTGKTQWAYDILEELNFTYSSSVLPAKNPLYGWPEFGQGIKRIKGILEMPVTLFHPRYFPFPLAGGIYFRIFPFVFVNYMMKKIYGKSKPILGYLHPYDIDENQERVVFPEFKNNKLFNRLMYYNRKSVFKKLQKLYQIGYTTTTYAAFLSKEFPGGLY